MYINLKEEDLKKLEELINIREDNIFVSSLYNEYLELKNYDDYDDIFNFKTYEESKEFFLDSLSLDLYDKYTFNKIKEYKIDEIPLIDVNKYLDNPYIKNIKVKEVKFKNDLYHLYYKTYKPYEGFIYNEIKVDDSYREINSFGMINKSFKYLTLDKNNTTWMSLIPHEINTMDKIIIECKGNVLIYGLGLAYFPYMVSLKDEVNKIVVIEKDQSIIELITKFILPLFNKKSLNKIEIIHDDALIFNSKLDKYKTSFDYVFVDLYHNPLDALPIYLKLVKEENKNIKYFYWIEKSIICYLRRIIISLFNEDIDGLVDEDYKLNKNSDYIDILMSKLHFYFADKEINSFNKIMESLKDDSIKDIIRNIKI